MGVYIEHKWGDVTIPAKNHAAALAAILADPGLSHEVQNCGTVLPCASLGDALLGNGWSFGVCEDGSFSLELPEKYHDADMFLLAAVAPFVAKGSELCVEMCGDVYRWTFTRAGVREQLGRIIFNRGRLYQPHAEASR